MKRVVRRYYSKKLGEYVEKTYEYKGYKKVRTTKLFDVNSGHYVLREKEWNDFINKIKNDTSMTGAEKITVKNDLERIKNDILRGKSNYRTPKGRLRRIDESSMLSRISENKTERFALNMGYSTQELADMLTDEKNNIIVTEEDILNSKNWGPDHTFSFGGNTWIFTFKYNGLPFVKSV